jgi:hypothetical protein
MSTWRLRAVATAGAVLWAALAGWLVGGWGGAFATRVADDLGYLLFPAGAAAALMLYPSGRAHQSRSRLLLHGVVASGSLSVCWVAVMGRVYRAGGGDGLCWACPWRTRQRIWPWSR